MEKPKQIGEVDLQKLREVCQQYIDFIDNDEEYHDDNDYDHYIFEKALEAIFGKEVWKFINYKKTKL